MLAYLQMRGRGTVRTGELAGPLGLTPEQERRYMLHGVGEFIQRAATNQPLLLVFEDLHWADESTVLLLRHLGTHLSTMRVMRLSRKRLNHCMPCLPC